MRMIVARTRLVMIVIGVLNCTMLYLVFFPEQGITGMFGESYGSSPVADILVRSWGLLIALLGVAMIHVANRPVQRPVILFLAGVSKGGFILLNLVLGQVFLHAMAATLVVDTIATVLLAICFAGAVRETQAAPTER